jgi:hypothetical protein
MFQRPGTDTACQRRTIAKDFFESFFTAGAICRLPGIVFATIVSTFLMVGAAAGQTLPPLSTDSPNTFVIPQSDNQNSEEAPRFTFPKAEKQPDGGLRAENGDDFAVQTPDSTTIVHIELYLYPNGTAGAKDVFEAGPDCDNDSFKKVETKECLPDPQKNGQRFWFNVTYYEYTCKVKPGIRRIKYSAESTGEACAEAQPDLCQMPLKVKPVLTNKEGTVIWEDEAGKQYTVNYYRDGTATGFPGTAPPKPNLSDIGKWQIPPDVQKAAKELGKVLTDPDELLLGDCKKATSPPPDSSEKTTNPETPKESKTTNKESKTTKRPRKEATKQPKQHAQRESGTTSSAPGPAPGGGFSIGIGIPIGGLGGHSGGRDLGGGGRTGGGKD